MILFVLLIIWLLNIKFSEKKTDTLKKPVYKVKKFSYEKSGRESVKVQRNLYFNSHSRSKALKGFRFQEGNMQSSQTEKKKSQT